VRMPGPFASRDAEISLLVRKADIWIRATGAPAQIVHLAELATTLAKLKAGPLEKRTDLEIAAESDAIYVDVVKAIDAASTAGFVDWQLVSPPDLAQHP
ncbi:MAG: hypothetical protein NT062_05030, partial [Proteobacteria bacterium]|nr:hypothetical protein [Pseudomonadota bacterium]